MRVIAEKFSDPVNTVFQHERIKKLPCKTGNGKRVSVVSNAVKPTNQSRLYGFVQQGCHSLQRPVRIMAGVMIFLSQVACAVTDGPEDGFNHTGNGDVEVPEAPHIVGFVCLGSLGLVTVFLGCCRLLKYVADRSAPTNEKTDMRVQEQTDLREYTDNNEAGNQSDNISLEDSGNELVWIRRY